MMALGECNLFRVTGTSSCVVYFDNCITCNSDSIEIEDGSIWYISHCTGSTSTPSVSGGLIELVDTSPITCSFETCFNNDPVPSGYTINCSSNQFAVSLNATYYFSGISVYGLSTNDYPCSVQGCMVASSTGTTSTTDFYCAYRYDNVLFYDVCPSCSSSRTGMGDDLWHFTSGCCYDNFCLSTYYLPFSGFDGNYVSAGTYDNYAYYTGGTTPGYIYYSTGFTSWCLSTSLGGTCSMFGSSNCLSYCPDICDDMFNGNLCPTPTPSPTINCSSVDFEAIFDCNVLPSSTATQTPTPTPTITPTITPTNDPCTIASVSFTVNLFSNTPTPTPTATPVVTPIVRDCIISGDVTYNTLSGTILCPNEILKFADCSDPLNIFYYTSEIPYVGGSYVTGDTFLATVDNNPKCITFVGSVAGSNINNIYLFNKFSSCTLCYSNFPSPTPTQTSTATPTPTMTPTMTMTPSKSVDAPPPILHVYKLCTKNIPDKFIVQTVQYPNLPNAGTSDVVSLLVNTGSNELLDPNLPVEWISWTYIGPYSNLTFLQITTLLQSNNPGCVVSTFNYDFISNNANDFVSSPPAICQNGLVEQVYKFYLYTDCDRKYGVTQYVPVKNAGVIFQGTQTNPSSFYYADPITSLECWVYRGEFYGYLDPNTNTVLTLQPGTVLPPFTTALPHVGGNYFKDPTLFGSNYSSCRFCGIGD